jgi:hypothetical protein
MQRTAWLAILIDATLIDLHFISFGIAGWKSSASAGTRR